MGVFRTRYLYIRGSRVPSEANFFVVTREEVTYKVRCTPSEFRVGDKQSIKDATTTLTIESNYPESFTGELYCKLIGDTKLFKNGDKFTANGYGTYKFKCTLDKGKQMKV